MAVLIREGSLEEVIRIVDQIDEFAHKETVESLASRVDGKKSLILIAEDEGDLLGFKIGYQLDEHTFYSWFGGVSPLARNKEWLNYNSKLKNIG